MKKIVLALSAIVFFQCAQAQVSKGSLFTGGSVGLNSTTFEANGTNTDKNKSWTISPQVGIAIQQNKIFGIQLTVSGTVIENSISQKNTTHFYGGGVFYRQYYPLANKWMLFGQGGLSVIFGNLKSTANGINTGKTNSWQAGFGISPGVTYQVGKKIWLEANLTDLFAINYSVNKMTNLDQSGAVSAASKRKDFSANANLNGFSSINVGIRWIIPKA